MEKIKKKKKTQVPGKTSDRRAKLSEIWDSELVVPHIWGILGLVKFKVILRSFSALSIFRNSGLMIRFGRKPFWL